MMIIGLSMKISLSMKIIAFKSMTVRAPGDRLPRLPTTEASIFNPSKLPRREFPVKELAQDPLSVNQFEDVSSVM